MVLNAIISPFCSWTGRGVWNFKFCFADNPSLKGKIVKENQDAKQMDLDWEEGVEGGPGVPYSQQSPTDSQGS